MLSLNDKKGPAYNPTKKGVPIQIWTDNWTSWRVDSVPAVPAVPAVLGSSGSLRIVKSAHLMFGKLLFNSTY